MKRLSRLLIFSLFVFLVLSLKANARINDDFLRDRIEDIGISETYEDNIVEYVQDLSTDKAKLQKLEDKGRELLNELNEIKDNTELTVENIQSMYSYLKEVGTVLNVEVDYNLFKDSFTIKDNDTNTTLLKANKNELYTYFKNIKNNFLGEDDKELLKEIFNTYNIDYNDDGYYTESNFDYEGDGVTLAYDKKNTNKKDTIKEDKAITTQIETVELSQEKDLNKLYYLGIFIPLLLIGGLGIYRACK